MKIIAPDNVALLNWFRSPAVLKARQIDAAKQAAVKAPAILKGTLPKLKKGAAIPAKGTRTVVRGVGVGVKKLSPFKKRKKGRRLFGDAAEFARLEASATPSGSTGGGFDWSGLVSAATRGVTSALVKRPSTAREVAPTATATGSGLMVPLALGAGAVALVLLLKRKG